MHGAIGVNGANAGLFQAGAEIKVVCCFSNILLLQQLAGIWGEPGLCVVFHLADCKLCLFTAG